MSATAPVFLAVGSGFVLRNLLLGKFSAHIIRERPLVAAVQRPDDPYLVDFAADKPITLTQFHEYMPPPRWGWDKLRDWEFYIHPLTAAAKHTRTIEMRYERLAMSRPTAWKRTLLRGVYQGSRLMGSLGITHYLENAYLRQIARWEVTQKWRVIIQQHRPIVVVSSLLSLGMDYAPSLDLPLVIAAHELGIPVGTLIQSWDNLSGKSGILPDWVNAYWAWSTWMSDELLALYPRLNRKQVTVIGSPQFDYHCDPAVIESRESYLLRLGLDPARPYVVFGTGTTTRLYNDPITALKLAQALHTALPQVQLLIRLHPKDDGSRWQPYLPQLAALGATLQQTAPALHMDRGGFIPPKIFFHDQVNALYHAAVVLNSSSTLSIDAAVLDRPVICILYDYDDDPLYPDGKALTFARLTHNDTLVQTGGLALAHSEDECIHHIQAYLENPALRQAERRHIVEVVAGQVDGQAGVRLAEAVLKMG